MNKIYQEDAKIFKALCDENRLHILSLLRSGEKCACELLKDLDMGQPALSYHMKVLLESQIVESWQEGKWTHYKISEQGCEKAAALLKDITTSISNQNDIPCNRCKG
jgi:ArsR family transcriptional regulator, arsenate/arsenite/antimonite-responsive transcriptional repressor